MNDEHEEQWLKAKQRFVHTEITRWIGQEHTLLSNRMGWLVSANAFLFTPVVLLLGSSADPEIKRLVLRTICALGAFLAVLLYVPIHLAVHTMGVLRKRYKIFLKEVEGEKKYHFVDPERGSPQGHGWPTRWAWSHQTSMAFQLLVPGVLLGVWAWFFCLLWSDPLQRGDATTRITVVEDSTTDRVSVSFDGRSGKILDLERRIKAIPAP